MTCPPAELLAASLDGELTANQQQSTAAHLSGCRDCRDVVRRMTTAVDALPAALEAKEDAAFVGELMAQVDKPRPAAPRYAFGGALALAAAAVLAVVLLPRLLGGPEGEGTFTARGGASAASLAREVGLTVFVHPGSAAGLRHVPGPGEEVGAGDGFSFELYNRSGAQVFAMILAIDASGEAHWFYPGWTDPAQDPVSVALPPGSPVFSLPDGVTPENLAPGDLRVVAFFTRSPLRVSQVERALREGPLATLGQRVNADAEQWFILAAK
jgi:hypothetical protein